MAECILLKGGGGGLDPDELTATPDKVLSGYTAGVKGSDEPAGGTMPAKVSGQIANSCIMYNNYLYYRMPYGYYPNTYSATECESRIEQEKVASAIGLIPEKLLAGQWAAGVTGTATSDATATDPNVSTGYTYYANGVKRTGTLARQGGSTTTPGTANKTIVTAAKHVTGNIIVAGSGNLVAANIKKGVNIFGVTGTFEGFIPGAKDIYKIGAWGSGYAFSQLIKKAYGATDTAVPSSITQDNMSIFINGKGGFSINKAVNVTPYTAVSVRLSTSLSGSTRYWIGVVSSIGGYLSDNKLSSASEDATKAGVDIIVTANLSSVNQNAYIFIGASNATSGQVTTIKEIYFT